MAPTRALRLHKHSSAPRVTDCELATALHQKQRGKASGPDGVHAEFLRDGLTCKGRAFLWNLINATIFSGYIPQAWKHATWLTLLKPSRPPEESWNYRPISLTSVVAKVAERIVDARLRAHNCCSIAPQQAAYQRGCRTEDVFARLLDFTKRAWNKGHDAIYVPGWDG